MFNISAISRANAKPEPQYFWWLAVFCIVFIANIATTFWLAHNRVVLNYDGIFYVTLADLIQQGRLDHPMLEHRGWFYSYLIQLVSNLVQMDLQSSAYLLNAFFLTLITFAFALIVQAISSTSRYVFIISLCLIIMFPPLAKYKSMIIRDFGYIAFYMWSMVCLLKYLKSEQGGFLFVSAVFLLAGSLFRVESLFYLIVVSFFAVRLFVKNNFIHFTNNKKVMLSLALMFVLLTVFLINDISAVTHYLSYTLDYITGSITRLYNKLHISDDGLLLNLATALWDVLYELVRRLDFIYLIFAVIAYKRKLVLQANYQRYALLSVVILGVLILVLFRLKEGFISSRYTLSLALMVLALSPVLLAQMLSGWFSKTRKQKALVSLLFIALMAASLSKFKYSDRHIERLAGEWAVANVSDGQKVVSNNSKILYYADQFPYTKRGRYYYRFETSYMMDHYKASFPQNGYLLFLVDPTSQADLDKSRFFKARFNAPIEQIVNRRKKGRRYVDIYKLN